MMTAPLFKPFESINRQGLVASQELMDILKIHGFVECSSIGNFNSQGRYESGRTYYFRKNGECTICFLKDGRVHVLHGPLLTWQLSDFIQRDYLRILIAFCSLQQDQQIFFRNFLGTKCASYLDIFENLPSFEVEWKTDFRNHYSTLLLSDHI